MFPDAARNTDGAYAARKNTKPRVLKDAFHCGREGGDQVAGEKTHFPDAGNVREALFYSFAEQRLPRCGKKRVAARQIRYGAVSERKQWHL